MASSSESLGEAHSREDLRRELNQLAGGSGRVLTRRKVGIELRHASARAFVWLFVVPLLVLGVNVLSRRGIGGSAASLWLVAGSLLGPLLYVAARAGWAYLRYRPQRGASLSLYDRELGSKDRLVTADEFLDAKIAGADRSSAFMQAAVADAGSYSRRALELRLSSLPLPSWRIEPRSLWGIPAAAIVLWAMVSLHPAAQTPGRAANPSFAALTQEDARPGEATVQSREPVAPRTSAVKKKPEAVSEHQQLQAAAASRLAPEQKAAEGQAQAGSASSAQSSGQSSQTTGSPANQQNPGQQKKDEVPAPAKEKESDSPASKKPPAPQSPPAAMAMESSLSQGKSSGSSSSAVQFPTPEKPDKSDANPPELEADAAEDEEEQEKSTSVSRPDLYKRKPPVDRNLQSMAASPVKEDARANARGGAGARKKTRGVPSMILGVPVSDRVQGIPGPGSSKVVQENVRPSEETHALLSAQERSARSGAIGRIHHPDLLLWMQDVLRNYFSAGHSPATPRTEAED